METISPKILEYTTDKFNGATIKSENLPESVEEFDELLTNTMKEFIEKKI